MNQSMPDKPTLRIAVFASGGGSNFEAIVEAIERESIPAEVVLCICNREGAGVFERARRHNIDAIHLTPDTFSSEAEYCNELFSLFERYGVNFILLAGYLRMIPAEIVRKFHGRILNIHPALLPAFGGKGMYGRHVHQAVLDYGAKWTGVTVHLVDEEYDRGPIVLQEPVPVYQDDTPEILAARVLVTEHRLYPEAVRLFAENRVRIEGRRVYIDDK
jgi:phosphoribosylglycinamide formyltransferase-1